MVLSITCGGTTPSPGSEARVSWFTSSLAHKENHNENYITNKANKIHMVNNVDCRERTHVATIINLVGNRHYWCICKQQHQTGCAAHRYTKMQDTQTKHTKTQTKPPKAGWRESIHWDGGDRKSVRRAFAECAQSVRRVVADCAQSVRRLCAEGSQIARRGFTEWTIKPAKQKQKNAVCIVMNKAQQWLWPN